MLSPMSRKRTIASFAGALLLGACAPPVTEGKFDSPDPASRLYAIEKAMQTGDTSAVPQIVEQLDSDDPVVRMMAIEALKVLNDGETFDYRYDDPQPQRRAAIRRWVQSLEPVSTADAHSDDG
jgi:hypothetical protein